jgi:hypothetical protein
MTRSQHILHAFSVYQIEELHDLVMEKLLIKHKNGENIERENEIIELIKEAKKHYGC